MKPPKIVAKVEAHDAINTNLAEYLSTSSHSDVALAIPTC